MLFGDRAVFAIEAEAEPDLVPPSAVWGRMCVWCCGATLGDFEERHCALYPAYCSFRWLSSNIDCLWDDALAGFDDAATLDFLDEQVYGRQGDWKAWNRFDFLTNWGEQFDGVKAYIVGRPNGPVCILSRHLPARLGHSAKVSREAVVAASEAFVQWFEEHEQRLQPHGA